MLLVVPWSKKTGTRQGKPKKRLRGLFDVFLMARRQSLGRARFPPPWIAATEIYRLPLLAADACKHLSFQCCLWIHEDTSISIVCTLYITPVNTASASMWLAEKAGRAQKGVVSKFQLFPRSLTSLTEHPAKETRKKQRRATLTKTPSLSVLYLVHFLSSLRWRRSRKTGVKKRGNEGEGGSF